MKYSTLLSIIAGLVATASASPFELSMNPDDVTVIPIDPADIPAVYKEVAASGKTGAVALKKRADHGTYLCTDANWTGHCVNNFAPDWACVNVGSDLNDNISCVGPDAGAYCRFFFARDCGDSEGHFDAVSPGYSNLQTQVSGANDRISSYFCRDI